jgi:ubiquinol-cytochrome c reductase cytochrome b subunit
MDSPNKPKHRLRQWVEKRWPVAPVIRWGSVDEIPGGTKFAYVLGSATLALFVVLVITGVWQMFYYVPTVDHAYDSVMFLRLQVPLGWLIHGLHYWAAQAFIVVMGLHVVRVFIWAAYKKPRELTWLLGVVLLLLGAAFIFTGAILPWDTLGYWAGEVGTSMAGTVPWVGNFLKLLMRGGDTMGQMTLSRAFAVHVAILPALTAFFIIAHIVAFRQFGSVGPWKPKKPEKTGSFWPDQTFKDLLVVALILFGLICLAAFVRAPITGPADPLDNSYSPKPEWNFLFLYEALKAFKGSWEWIGTVVIPTLLVLLLFAVPFIDRNEKKNPFQRPIAMLCGFMFVTAIIVLTFIGYYSSPGAGTPAPAAASSVSTNAPASTAAAPASTNQVDAPAASATNSATPAATPAAPPVSTNAPAPAAVAPTPTNQVAAATTAAPAAPKPNAVPSQTNAVAGNASSSTNQSPTYLRDVLPILAASCSRCHSPQTVIYNWLNYKAVFGDRWEIRRRVWASPKGWYYKEAMPLPGSPEALAFTDAQRLTIRNWVDSGAALGVAPPPVPVAAASTNPADGSTPPGATAAAGDVQAGQGLFTSAGCVACHMMEGKGGKVGPDLSHEAKLGRTSQWLTAQITDPKKHDPTTKMPPHPSLTPAQLKSLADYILKPAPGAAAAGAPPVASAAPAVSTNAPASAATTNQVATTATATASPAPPAAVAGQTNTTAATGASQAGKALFVSAGCAACHMMEGKGGKVGPDLSHEAKLGRSSQWLTAQITDPKKHDPTTKMPPHPNLTPAQLKGLADYILKPSSSPAAPGASTTANAAPDNGSAGSNSPGSTPPDTDASTASATVVPMIGDAKHGAVLFAMDCAKCHGKDGEGHVPNPGSLAGMVPALAPISRALFTNDPVAFAANIDQFIQHGATPPGPGPTLQMPALGATRSLTLPEIANIEAYVLSLNGVDAAKIIHPGITPAHFVAGTAVLLMLALLAIGGLWVHYRTEGSSQPAGGPTPEEFQTLQNQVADLKDKLEQRETSNSEDRSGSGDS